VKLAVVGLEKKLVKGSNHPALRVDGLGEWLGQTAQESIGYLKDLQAEVDKIELKGIESRRIAREAEQRVYCKDE
jgi:hypothetical protein